MEMNIPIRALLYRLRMAKRKPHLIHTTTNIYSSKASPSVGLANKPLQQ